MKFSNLSKAIAISLISSTMMNAAQANVAEKTGDSLANMGDSLYTGLTGKSVQGEIQHPVSLYDYTEATSAYEDAYISGRFNANNNANKVAVKDADDNVIGYTEQQASYDLVLNGTYDKVFSSPDSNTKLGARATSAINKSSIKDSEVQDNWNAGVDITYDRYFKPASNGLFWYGKGDINFIQESGDKDSDIGGIKNPRSAVSAGLGYGRVVNVTPMAKAIRLIESLIERGVLKNVPNQATYARVAEITAKENEYRSQYGVSDYAQYWIKDIEQALAQSIGANGAIKAYDVLTSESVSTRKYGWDVRAGIGAQLSDYNGINDDIKPKLEAEANYYYPIGLKTQFSNESRFETVLDDDNNAYILGNRMGLTYELSDRVDWNNSWDISYTNQDNAKDITTNTLSSSFIYQISNALSFDTTVTASHVADGINDNGNDKVDVGLTSGIKYRMK